MTSIFIVWSILTIALNQVSSESAGIRSGQCKYVQPVAIDFKLLEGPWYAVRRAIAAPFVEQNSDCEFQKLSFAKNKYGLSLIYITPFFKQHCFHSWRSAWLIIEQNFWEFWRNPGSSDQMKKKTFGLKLVNRHCLKLAYVKYPLVYAF